jgi:hypothetical protein
MALELMADFVYFLLESGRSAFPARPPGFGLNNPINMNNSLGSLILSAALAAFTSGRCYGFKA